MAVLWLSPSDTFQPAGEFTISAVEHASNLLYILSGRKYPGVQTVTEAYTSRDGGSGTVSLTPTIFNGEIFNVAQGASAPRELHLRNTPVRSVSSVYEDGVLLPTTEYTLRNGRYLVKAGGRPWVIDPLREITVTYQFGTNPPASGKRAAIRLANELILLDMNDDRCALPQHIQSVSRQGVSYTLVPPQDYLEKGRIGIPEVDAFLAAVNAEGARKKAKVFSVDRPRGEKII